MLYNSSILVTGGAGFIGSNFVRYLLRTEPEVRIVNLDLLTYCGSLLNLQQLSDPQRHTFVKGDVADSHLIARLLSQHRIDVVVHFAAESHVDRSIAGPEAFVQTNVVGTFRLLEAARLAWQGRTDQCRLVHVSTDEVFGALAPADPPFCETTRYAPNSPYSASKAAADHLVRAYHETYALPTITTHCSNNYGPYQHPEKLIPLIIARALGNQPLPVYGDGRQVRDWLHVEDHCKALRRVVAQGQCGSSYCIGGSSEQQNIEVVRQLCQILDQLRPRPDGTSYTGLITHVTDRLGHDRRYAIDSSKIQRELGWQPGWSFADGLRATAAWYLDHEDWIQGVRKG